MKSIKGITNEIIHLTKINDVYTVRFSEESMVSLVGKTVRFDSIEFIEGRSPGCDVDMIMRVEVFD